MPRQPPDGFQIGRDSGRVSGDALLGMASNRSTQPFCTSNEATVYVNIPASVQVRQSSSHSDVEERISADEERRGARRTVLLL